MIDSPCCCHVRIYWLHINNLFTLPNLPELVMGQLHQTHNAMAQTGLAQSITFASWWQRCNHSLCRCFQTYMFPNEDHSHISVLEDGTLLITSVRMDDSGVYLCKGLSIAGTAVAKVRLDVLGKYLLYSCTRFRVVHISPLVLLHRRWCAKLLKQIHSLAVQWRIRFKHASLTYKALDNTYRSSVILHRPFTVPQTHEVYAFICQCVIVN